MAKKEYKGQDITVVWKPELCSHSANCAKGLSNVFMPREKPWINLEGASEEQIAEQVQKCPSRALSFYKNK